MPQSPTPADHDLIVAGAGISGLSLGHLAARMGLRVLVLEREATPGGCVRTARQDPASGPAGPFWLELGPHTCYNSYVNLIGLLETCGLGDRLLRRAKVGFRLLVGGQLRSIASQLRVGELLLSLPGAFVSRKAGQSIRSYYARILGQGNYDRVFRPLFNAVACQDADELDAAYLFKRRPGRRKDLPRSFTLDGGLQTLTDALAATPGLELRTGARAVAVWREGETFKVRLEDSAVLSASVLALATPPPEAARLLADIEPELARLLGGIRVNRLHALGLAVGRERASLPPLAGVVSPDDTFHSMVSRDVVPHPSWRGFTFHFREDDKAANLRRALAVLGLGEAAPQQVEGKTNEIPALGVGHADLVRRIDGLLAGTRLLLAGNYLLGLSLEDCVARSRAEAARLAALLPGAARPLADAAGVRAG